MFIDQWVEAFSSKTGLTDDRARYLISVSVIFFLGHVFRTVCHVRRVGSTVRYSLSLAWGLSALWFIFGRQGLHLVVPALLTFLEIVLLDAKIVHIVVLVTSMAYLSAIHIHRQLIEDGSTFEITTPLMFAVIKMTYMGFAVHDLHPTKEVNRKISNGYHKGEKDHYRITPTLLQYLSYVLNFSSLICGPPSEFHEYKEFIEGNHNFHHQNGNVNNNNEIELKEEPSPVFAGLTKYISGHVTVLIYVLLEPYLSPGYLADDNRLQHASLLSNILFVESVVYLTKAKYYSAFYLGEACCNMSGYGFNAYTGKWDKFKTLDMLKIEKARSIKEVKDGWNIQTNRWLKKCFYQNAPFMPMFFTFFFSALWHGFYAGYYAFFLAIATSFFISRKVRKNIRPHFQHSTSHKIMYDVITAFFSRIVLSFFGAAFILMDMEATMKFWCASYWYGFVVIAGGLALVFIAPDYQSDAKQKSKAS